ncbi:MAG: 8-amino-7-oxononanoate synthase [Turneriella sp.]|nr:8-amino-7-oxononanoate synthase [Turneriella sp.]
MEFFDSTVNSFLALVQKTNRERNLEVPDKTFIDLCSNDYLNLSESKGLIAALHEGIGIYGLGSTASRLIRGHRTVFEFLEKKYAEWVNAESALFFANGYAANLGSISVIADASYEVFIDRLAHASLVDGVRLSGAHKTYFRHNDIRHLEELLKKSKTTKKLIITESIFSMDGDLAPLEEISTLAKKYGALTYVDDAHALGVYGNTGKGLALSSTDFRMGTFGKALGLEGAMVALASNARKYLLHKARTFVFSTAPLPAIAHAALFAVDLVKSMDVERKGIQNIAAYLRKELEERNFSTLTSATHIVPIVCGSERGALALAKKLEERKFHTKAIRPPTANPSRLRVSINAKITEGTIDAFLEAME